MAQVVYSASAVEQIGRVSEPAAHAGIRSAVEALASHPLVGRRIEDDVRELIISFGATGYIALYRFVIQLDEVRVLALRHQREIGYLP